MASFGLTVAGLATAVAILTHGTLYANDTLAAVIARAYPHRLRVDERVPATARVALFRERGHRAILPVKYYELVNGLLYAVSTTGDRAVVYTSTATTDAVREILAHNTARATKSNKINKIIK